MVKFKIICTGWQCGEYYERCLDSILSQDYPFFDVYVCIDEMIKINDKIKDEYINIINYVEKIRKEQKRVHIIFEKYRWGKMRNFCAGSTMLECNPDDVLVDIDLDDYPEPGALKIVAAEYEKNPELLLTHGSYRMESGRPARFNGEYKSDRFRQLRWNASHLKTFKYKLFKRIKQQDFKGLNGRWLMTCADVAMMFPMLEMAGLDRVKHIPQCLYCYNDLNPVNDHKVHKEDQVRTTRYLMAKPRYARVEF